ncbi:hypothetical protein LHFGNBLO_006180 (plasmid) [Mesorhizobium sp. AR10]|uniref:hypothetical protein n=1 Tax=Mesorhizobium sp. AR10 TaxID=2865839 RepID=UPI00215F6701|nr:hypothetical protein [Mesorhizobium sp. AR10]UVK35919.1 hypothetical protein LHFGNBLO_006180 [Mesorhizobium sp. AR10]
MSAFLHHDYRCAGYAISNRSHPLNADIAFDTNIEQNRPCGFLRGVCHTIPEWSIEALDVAECLLKQGQFNMLRHHGCESARRLERSVRRQR